MASSDLDALLTSRYGDWKRPIASPNSFQASLPFVASEDKSGKDFRYPILTAISQGHTPDNTGGVVTLNGVRSGKNNQAVLDGVNLYIRDRFSYSDLQKMRNGASSSGQAAAYDSAPDWTMFSMLRGLKHAGEIMAMHGCGNTSTTIANDIGVLATVPVISGGPNYNSGTGVVVQLTHGSWAKLLWLNSGSGGDADKGMLVDVYATNGLTLKANNIQVVGVQDSTKCQIKLFATAATSVGAGTAPAATDRLVPAGWNNKAAFGVMSQAKLVGSFAGIDNTAIPQWRCQTFDAANSALSFDMLQLFMGKLTGNGAQGDFDIWLNPNAVTPLVNSINSQVQYINEGASSDSKTVGTGRIQLVTPAGRCTLRPYGYCKQGEVMVINRGEAVRIGAAAADSDSAGQGAFGGMALEIADASGTEVRAAAQFAPLLTTPFFSGIITGVKNTSDDISAGDST